MADPSEPALLELSADYSADELDALAELFDRPRLRRRREAPDGLSEQVRRAVADAALRALVARRALVLEGPPARPRVRLLEPHASLFDPFVSPEAAIAVRVERARQATTTVLYLRGDGLLVEEGLPGIAVSRLTLRPRAVLEDQLLSLLPDVRAPDRVTAEPVELTQRMVLAGRRAVSAGERPPDCVPAPARDVFHATRFTVGLEVTARGADGVIDVERRAWFDAGATGCWELVDGDEDPPVTATLVPGKPRAVSTALRAVARWLASPAPPGASG